MNKYEIQKLGEVEYFLGVRIVRDRSQRKLWLVQDSYIDKIAKKYNITLSTKPPKTPLPTTNLVLYKGTTIAQEIYAYQQRIRSMNFNIIITQLDISKTISKLLEFLQNLSLIHLVVANQTLEYLVTTKFLAIEFNRNQQDKKIFITSSNSAFVDNSNTCYSSYGFCFLLYSRLIYYKVVKGTIVTTSSTEAKLLALSTTAKDFIWWMRLFQNI